MKNIIIIFSIITAVQTCHSTPEKQVNVNNLRQVQIGMTIDTVYKIMGKPDSVLVFPTDSKRFRLMYDTPFGMSDNIYIFIDDVDSTVVGINDRE